MVRSSDDVISNMILYGRYDSDEQAQRDKIYLSNKEMETYDKIYSLRLHSECKYDCSLTFIEKYVEKHPQSPGLEDHRHCLPLHMLFRNDSSPSSAALLLIE